MDNAQEAPVSTCPVPFCGKEFKDYRSVYRHLARVHRLNNDDPIWQQHSRDFGGNKPRASCPWCANTFRNLSVHKKTCRQRPAVEPPPTLASTRGLPPEKQQLVVDLLGGGTSPGKTSKQHASGQQSSETSPPPSRTATLTCDHPLGRNEWCRSSRTPAEPCESGNAMRWRSFAGRTRNSAALSSLTFSQLL